jgi:hypothetical protein
MTWPDQAARPPGAVIRPSTLLLGCVLVMLESLGCFGGGNRSTGDHAGQLNGQFQITPPTATVITGQTLHFSASSPWGGGATWYVMPASGGTCDASGTFTASSTLGQYQIIALWNDDVRYTATATVWVVAPAAHLNPNLVQAFGVPQASGNGSTRTTPVVGESVPAQSAAAAGGTTQVRHGFDPPVPH